MASYSDATKILVQEPVLRRWKANPQTWKPVAVSVLEYILAIAAVVDILQNAIEVGHWSVLNWHCMTTILPLIWAAIPVVIHLVKSVTFRYLRGGRAIRNAEEYRTSRGSAWSFKRLLTKEHNPCFNRRTKIPSVVHAREIRLGNGFICVQWLCGLLAIAHVLFGSEVLSCLLYIHPLSAFDVVGGCMVSGLICCLIVVLDIAGLQGRLKIREEVERQEEGFADLQDKGPSARVTRSDSIPWYDSFES